MKKQLLILLACGLVATTAVSQNDLGFYRPLTLAPADATSSSGGGAGQEQAQQAELAKAAQNPLAKMISVPLQNNFNFGVGPNDAPQWILNVQPIIPITLSEEWNLITRTIIPIINQPSPAPGDAQRVRPGRHQSVAFFLPCKIGQVDLGRGPNIHVSDGDRFAARLGQVERRPYR